MVLCYHAISSTWPDVLAVAPAAFERQLRWLIRLGYRPVDAATAVAGRGRGLHVTFDDAYRNVVEALPVLERYGVPATVFACSGYAESGRALDVPELVDRIRGHEAEAATMDWQALRELAERGVEIGSHTVSHAHLTRLGDAELQRELVESRERLEDELGQPCRWLAYPFGEHDDRVQAAAARAGYEAAFALRSAVRTRWTLPRIDLYRGDSLAWVALKTSPARTAVLAARTVLERRRSGNES